MAYPVRRGIGVFAGNAPLPQDVGAALVDQFMVGVLDDPGIRLAGTTDRGGGGATRYFGADLLPQGFVRSPAGPNAPEQLALAAIGAGNARRALSRNRGTPGVL